jgi:hypothetical protein
MQMENAKWKFKPVIMKKLKYKLSIQKKKMQYKVKKELNLMQSTPLQSNHTAFCYCNFWGALFKIQV